MAMQRVEMPLGSYTLSIETGRLAKQSDGAVLVRLGDTVVLATANAQKDAKAGVDFLPLTVDYRENTYAAGKIPGGAFKRHGRPNDQELLTSQISDRNHGARIHTALKHHNPVRCGAQSISQHV